MNEAASNMPQKAAGAAAIRCPTASFAETAAGQEVARWFFPRRRHGGALAKAISAYDTTGVSEPSIFHGEAEICVYGDIVTSPFLERLFLFPVAIVRVRR
jgi:hypothetical protein